MDKEITDLIEGLRRQERQAQRSILQAYGEMVFSQVARIVPSQEDAEEVYQDVFIKVFRSIGSYDPQKASFAVWLSRIAYHEALNFVRRHKPPVIYIDDNKTGTISMEDDTAIQEQQQIDEQTVELLEKALEHLPPKEQALITMFYFDGRSIKEIAYITDSGASTVGSQLCRTRKKIYHIIKSLQQ